MQILKPLTVTDAVLTSSNVPEADYAAYAAGTTYALAARVIVVADHKIYESLQAGNVGHTPSSSPTYWSEVSSTNRWKMFDQTVGTATEKADAITVTLTPGELFDSVSVLEVSASTVRVVVDDPEYGTVFDETQSLLLDTGITDWYAYFFSPIARRTTAVFDGIPPSLDTSETTITITDTGSTAACGVCLVGRTLEAGSTLSGVSVGIQDYSRKERDDWGAYSITERAYSKRARFSLTVPKYKVDELQALLASVRATPALYIGSQSFDSAVVYGFYKDFDIQIAYSEFSECTLDIEGLV